MAVVAVVSAIALPATADPRTITVLMPDGSMVTVQVDVPRGTPLTSISLPSGGVPVEDSWGELQAPAPAPAPETPPGTPAPDPLRQQQEDQQQQQAQQQESAQKAEEQAKEEEEAEKRERTKKRRRADREEDEVDEEEAAEEEERTKRRRRRDLANRNPDGSPTRTNPSFIEALPGPARVTGVPNFVIRKFRVPIFLLPIYQAAGIQYGVRWEILAAINEIETDYGRNLNVSSAGALGWMQFMPSTWRSYGVDANKDGEKDPYNPVDAIFAAARYLRAAGYAKDVRRALFAYNHADWYVDSVLLRARLIAGVPGDLVGSLTGLTEGRFPVYAKARYADDLTEKEAEKRFRR
ncbi:MAG TPA: lytic transglycosylase domain-containing protein, partial [Aggregicoccus sp.]|nr:lytic transglycosylase domain-containing protein [Aggregicoccus sp.]